MKRGHSIGSLVGYLFGPGKANEHRDQRIIAADDVLDLADGTRLDQPHHQERIRRLSADMDALRRLATVEPFRGWVWHCAISLPPDERLTDTQWAEAARMVVQRLKFTDDPEQGRAACRWIAVHHGPSKRGNDHIHLAVNLVREDGTFADPGRDKKAMARICGELERRFGLSVVEGRASRGMPTISRAELARVDSGQRDEPDRLTLARHVRAAEASARNEVEFVSELLAAGLLVQPRYGPGKATVTGYSVALPAPEGGKPVWFGGGKLAPDLTLPSLRTSWPATDPRHAADAWIAAHQRRSSRPATAPPPRLPSSSWEAAAAQVTAFTQSLKQVPPTDVSTWTDAAREAAGLYAVLWHRIERGPGPLAVTADGLARAGQSRTRPTRRRRPLHSVAHTARHAPIGRSERSRNGWVQLIRALIDLVFAIIDVLEARAQQRHAAALTAASNAQLSQIQRLPSAPDPDPELAEVRAAVSFLNDISPQDLLRRGSNPSTHRRTPAPPSREPDRGVGR
ncbi:relaxase/mobilization nuclease domain-containing protein [Actinocorallia libanotica]